MKTTKLQDSTEPSVAPVNEVRLVGRVSAGAEERVLPSGQRLVTFRVVVPREPGSGGSRRGEGPRGVVDTIAITCWKAVPRRQALTLRASDTVEVLGRLRRHFFAAGGAKVSRYEVEATTVSRLSRAPAPRKTGRASSPASADARAQEE